MCKGEEERKQNTRREGKEREKAEFSDLVQSNMLTQLLASPRLSTVFLCCMQPIDAQARYLSVDGTDAGELVPAWN